MRIDGKRVSTFPNERLHDMYATKKSPAGAELSDPPERRDPQDHTDPKEQ